MLDEAAPVLGGLCFRVGKLSFAALFPSGEQRCEFGAQRLFGWRWPDTEDALVRLGTEVVIEVHGGLIVAGAAVGVAAGAVRALQWRGI